MDIQTTYHSIRPFGAIPTGSTVTGIECNINTGACTVMTQEKKEETMKKYFTHSGSGSKYETREDAEKSAKKYMESMSKAYGTNHDVYILEAIACITFPLPAYEVVNLAAKA